MLRQVTAGTGNLLLNIGPKPDGAVPQEAVDRLTVVGNWLQRYGNEVVYGNVDRIPSMDWLPSGNWSRRGKTMYFWCTRWPGRELTLGGLRGQLQNVRLLPGGKPLSFTQELDRLIIRGLPETCPDAAAQVSVFAMEFKTVPHQTLGCGCEPAGLQNDPTKSKQDSRWTAPFIPQWQLSLPVPKTGDVSHAECVRLKDNLGWTNLATSSPGGFANAHGHYPQTDGIVWFGCRVKTARSGCWTAHLGHDGGARMLVDGQEVYCDPKRINPATPDRARFPVKLRKGTHEILVAMDLDRGQAWGIFLNFSIPTEARDAKAVPVFPEPA
jgi:hypothetical protein